MNPPNTDCPTWDDFIRPVLELAAEGEITARLARQEIPQRLKLSDTVMSQFLKSGQRRVDNRIGWAMSHLVKAGLIHKIRTATYAITPEGRTFLQENAGKQLSVHDLRKIAGFEEAWQEASRARQQSSATGTPAEHETSTPEESIDEAIAQINQQLRAELQESLASINPYRFEQVVLDLLHAMGYGGSREEAAQVTQKSNDEGIDGIINEDSMSSTCRPNAGKTRWAGEKSRASSELSPASRQTKESSSRPATLPPARSNTPMRSPRKSS